MSRVEVDSRSIDAAASTLRTAAEELAAVGQRIGGALHLVGTAGGSASLAAGGALAARRWSTGLEGYAEAGLALSRTTAQASLAYQLVELRARGRFTPTVLP